MVSSMSPKLIRLSGMGSLDLSVREDQLLPEERSVCSSLQPFRDVHKRALSQQVTISGFGIKRKRVTQKFISSIIALHQF